MCFIVDVCSRMIVGWRVASHMRTEMVLDAIEMARWSRGTRIDGGSGVTATPDLSSRPSATANASLRSVRHPRSGPSRTVTTTPSRASTEPRAVHIADLDVRVIHAITGGLLRELTIYPTREYQPQQRKRAGP